MLSYFIIQRSENISIIKHESFSVQTDKKEKKIMTIFG